MCPCVVVREQFVEMVFFHVGPRDGAMVVRLGGKPLAP